MADDWTGKSLTELKAMAEQASRRRAELMPEQSDALAVLFEAHQRLRELGWREAMYCPKDGSAFLVVEAGSTGVHRCVYRGEWPNGWWITESGDMWPAHPILWRPLEVPRG